MSAARRSGFPVLLVCLAAFGGASINPWIGPLLAEAPGANGAVEKKIVEQDVAEEITVELGRRLYEKGLGTDGAAIVAVIASPDPEQPGVELPATALPCGSCHGSDGRGRPEGGSDPADLRWSTLTRPWQLTTPSVRRRGPYDERTLVRAVTLGFDSAGHRLGLAMPRYRLRQADARVLLAYLRSLGRKTTPGVGDESVTIGVLLPAHPSAESRAALGVLRAWQSDLAGAGGIHGRRPVLQAATPETAASVDAALLIALPGAPAFEDPSVPVLWLGEAAADCRICFAASGGDGLERRRRHLAARHGLGAAHAEAQRRALAAADAATRALEAAGRSLDIESVVAALRHSTARRDPTTRRF